LFQLDLLLWLIAWVHISPCAKLNFIVLLQIFVTDIRHSQHMTCNTGTMPYATFTLCSLFLNLWPCKFCFSARNR
jgi:hypothetical protein